MAPSSSTNFDYQHVVDWSAAPVFTLTTGDISPGTSTVSFTDPTPSGGTVTIDSSVSYEYVAGVNGNNGIILKNGSTYFLFTNQTLAVGATGSANTAEDLEVVCLMAGTEILTSLGPKLVENLVTGDLVLASNGNYLPVRWIGVQTVSTVFNGAEALPVKISRNALGPNSPDKDLFVSQNHAIYSDGILINAIALINGKTITLEKNVPDTIQYFGLDLGPAHLHTVHNLLVGSLGGISREQFDNYSEWLESGLELIDEPLILPRIKSEMQLLEQIG